MTYSIASSFNNSPIVPLRSELMYLVTAFGESCAFCNESPRFVLIHFYTIFYYFGTPAQ